MKTQISSKWSHAILVCKKCTKKLKGGFGPDGDQKLAKILRKTLNAKKGRKGNFGVVEVPCLGVCPKGGVVVVDTRCPGNWRIVRAEVNVAKVICEVENICLENP